MKRLIVVLAVMLAACGSDEPPPQGRAETQAIRNTDAVGAGGAAVADKVDGALDKSEEANKLQRRRRVLAMVLELAAVLRRILHVHEVAAAREVPVVQP
jgi:hypothetical protein